MAISLQSLLPSDRLRAAQQRRALVTQARTRRMRSRQARRVHGPQPPSDLAYRSALRQLARSTWNMIVAELLPRADARTDAQPQGLRFKLYDMVKAKAPALAAEQAKRVAKKTAEDTRRVLGLDPRTEIGVAPMLDVFVGENVRLITKLVDAQYQDVHETLQQNLGLRHEDLSKILTERLGVSESRADLIARDQTLKLAGDVTRIRQTNAGIDSYVWTTSGDERVRPEHEELDGQTFRWDAPPAVGHPGQDYQCRCAAYPVVPGFEDEG